MSRKVIIILIAFIAIIAVLLVSFLGSLAGGEHEVLAENVEITGYLNSDGEFVEVSSTDDDAKFITFNYEPMNNTIQLQWKVSPDKVTFPLVEFTIMGMDSGEEITTQKAVVNHFGLVTFYEEIGEAIVVVIYMDKSPEIKDRVIIGKEYETDFNQPPIDWN
jgi:hypothetical protein